MVAVSVDYRIGYLHHSTPFESFEDAKDAICWLRSHASDYQLDPDKIAVAGGSAGGHLAAALGTIGSDETVPAGYRPNLSVLYYPVIDMVSRGYGFPEIKRVLKKFHRSIMCRKQLPPLLYCLARKILSYRSKRSRPIKINFCRREWIVNSISLKVPGIRSFYTESRLRKSIIRFES